MSFHGLIVVLFCFCANIPLLDVPQFIYPFAYWTFLITSELWKSWIKLLQTSVCRFLGGSALLFLYLYFLQWNFLFFFLKIFYVFIFRERNGGRQGETSMCGCLLRAPYWGSGLQPRPVPWLGIEPAVLWFTGWHSVHWATAARAKLLSVLKGT